MKMFKRIMLNLLGILLIGLILSGLGMLAQQADMKREQELTAKSIRYEIVARSGYVVLDQSGKTPGNSISTYRLKQGLKPAILILDFTNEPGIEKYALEHQSAYVRIDGIMRSEEITTDYGATVSVEVIEVLKLRRYQKK